MSESEKTKGALGERRPLVKSRNSDCSNCAAPERATQYGVYRKSYLNRRWLEESVSQAIPAKNGELGDAVWTQSYSRPVSDRGDTFERKSRPGLVPFRAFLYTCEDSNVEVTPA
jgi:hypothetical protein